MSTLTCLRCSSPMESGFIVDRGHGDATKEQEWVEGAVVKTFWRGVHTHDREKAKVVTYRCTQCGYLESYAAGE